MPDDTAPVRFYVDDDARLPKTVKSQLLLLRKEIGETIIGGYPQGDSQYRQQVGFVKGLEKAIELCDEAEKELTGR